MPQFELQMHNNTREEKKTQIKVKTNGSIILLASQLL